MQDQIDGSPAGVDPQPGIGRRDGVVIVDGEPDTEGAHRVPPRAERHPHVGRPGKPKDLQIFRGDWLPAICQFGGDRLGGHRLLCLGGFVEELLARGTKLQDRGIVEPQTERGGFGDKASERGPPERLPFRRQPSPALRIHDESQHHLDGGSWSRDRHQQHRPDIRQQVVPSPTRWSRPSRTVHGCQRCWHNRLPGWLVFWLMAGRDDRMLPGLES